MEVAVFGTGYVFRKYRNKISCNICCLVDNAPDKQGDVIEGIRVIPPDELSSCEYTYIVVMTFEYAEIEQQLLKMGVPREKILNYTHICAIRNSYPQVHINNNRKPLEEWLNVNRGKKKFLLVSHDFSYTGVPAALLNMALVLKRMGYAVIMAGLTGGAIVRELEINDINYLEELNICYGTEWFGTMAVGFDYIIAGTLVLNKFVYRCSFLPVRILWWLHESDSDLYENTDISWLSENIKIYGGGNRVIDTFRMSYPDKNIEKLLYCISKTKSVNHKTDMCDQNITFAVVGTICYRKAQDIAINAIKSVSQKYSGHFRCLVIGADSGIEYDYCRTIEEEISHIEEIKRIGEMNQEQLDRILQQIDVLLCPSRDDPMPIVVTQAMMHGKVCIIAENVGQAEYIRQGENGFRFKNESIEDLTGYMVWAIEHKEMLYQIGNCSREVYDNNFSEEVMERNIRNILDEWDDKGICE